MKNTWRNLKNLGNYFGIPYSPELFQNYKKLVDKLIDPKHYPDWCRTKMSSPSLFWMKALKAVEVDPNLEKLIKTAIGNIINDNFLFHIKETT